MQAAMETVGVCALLRWRSMSVLLSRNTAVRDLWTTRDLSPSQEKNKRKASTIRLQEYYQQAGLRTTSATTSRALRFPTESQSNGYEHFICCDRYTEGQVCHVHQTCLQAR
ncbi:hypothetical protein ISCGN_029404 [Ixodes scapularis]